MVKTIKIFPFACLFALFLFLPPVFAGGMTASGEKMTTDKTGMLAGAGGHRAEGMVIIAKDQSGQYHLKIKDAKIDKVPDGRIYLAMDGEYKTGVELGKLKKFSGDLAFPVSMGVDVHPYNSVVVWCKKFDVEIGRASLKTGK